MTGELILTVLSEGDEFLGYERWEDYGNYSTYLEGNITYDQRFGNHSVSALLLYNQRNYDDGDQVPYRTQGFAGRAAYTYADRYIAEFNFGYNGSENFAKGKRFGFFPAAAIGWIVSQEKFMEPLSGIISNLKLRATWGKAGNSELGIRGRADYRRFAYISTIVDTGSYRWGTDAEIYRLGRSEGEIGVSDLTWETVTCLLYTSDAADE